MEKKKIYYSINLKVLLRRHWFFIAIFPIILFAETFPSLGATGGILHPEWTVKYLSVGVIFFISGISMTMDELLNAASSYHIHAFIQCFTFICIPVMVLVLTTILRFLFSGINVWILQGLLTVSCMPPPVSSAVIITKAIGGNEAAAVFNSILGSFIGIIISPILLLYFSGSTALIFMLGSMLLLGQTVLIPLIVGILLKHFKIIRSTKSLPLTFVGQLILLFIIYTTFCDAFIDAKDTSMTALDIVLSIFLVLLFHMLSMYVCFHTSQCFPWYSASDIVAITICSSYKSLTLGIPILRILFSGYSHFSQIMLPLLLYQPIQIMMGGFIAPPFKLWMISNKNRMKILP
ncbi:unnamed protein product [Nezara viridula]|uniref:Sodium/bile acid cotransporter n=1 Tax=Nezara viridula TaxID=85310 RepID=A0A9P0MJM4_NEZVI|nr:unnamed protein product [Nezara viridula]